MRRVVGKQSIAAGQSLICQMAIFGAFLLSIISTETRAGGPRPDWGPELGVTVGPAVGYASFKDKQGVAPGVDASFYHVIRIPFYFWVSAGGRMIFEGDRTPVMPYVETGFGIVLINVGVGYSPALNYGSVVPHFVQLFLGINAPIWSPKKQHLIYIEPYYRPAWEVSGVLSGTRHEVGGQIRWMWGRKLPE